jgi:hypothetical protein
MTTWKGLHSCCVNSLKDQRKDNNFFPQTSSSDEKLEALRQGASLAWSSTLKILDEKLRIIQRVMQSVSLDLFCQGLFLATRYSWMMEVMNIFSIHFAPICSMSLFNSIKEFELN